VEAGRGRLVLVCLPGLGGGTGGFLRWIRDVVARSLDLPDQLQFSTVVVVVAKTGG
jgi:hypothetical protein